MSGLQKQLGSFTPLVTHRWTLALIFMTVLLLRYRASSGQQWQMIRRLQQLSSCHLQLRMILCTRIRPNRLYHHFRQPRSLDLHSRVIFPWVIHSKEPRRKSCQAQPSSPNHIECDCLRLLPLRNVQNAHKSSRLGVSSGAMNAPTRGSCVTLTVVKRASECRKIYAVTKQQWSMQTQH